MPWVLPTFNRSAQLHRVMEQIRSVGCSTPGFIIINGDPQEYYDNPPWLPDNWFVQVQPTNLGICQTLERFFRNNPNEAWYGLICDDEYVFTPGWDEILPREAWPWNIAYGNDNWRSLERIHTYVTWGGDLLRAVGFWALPGLWHWYFDNVWEVIAKEFGLAKWCQDVQTEHRHWAAGAALRDNTYQVGASRHLLDRQCYTKWLEKDWPKLRGRLEGIVPAKHGD